MRQLRQLTRTHWKKQKLKDYILYGINFIDLGIKRMMERHGILKIHERVPVKTSKY